MDATLHEGRKRQNDLRASKTQLPVKTDRRDLRQRRNGYLGACLKYFKSGGGWSFVIGIKRPSALMA